MDDTEVLERLRDVLSGPLSRLDFESLSRFNRGYARYAEDPFSCFVRDEWPYYRRVLQWYRESVPAGARVLEVGMFIPVVPLLLTWAGYRVTTVERLDFYGGALDELVGMLRGVGVEVADQDVIADPLECGGYDVVNLLAVVEHLSGSPRVLLERLRDAMKPGGSLVFAVPNHAALHHRLNLFLRGASVHPSFVAYYDSEYPFTGHHREYTHDEMVYALRRAGLQVVETGSIQYPPRGTLASRAISVVAALLPATFHTALFAVAQRPVRDGVPGRADRLHGVRLAGTR
jgi:SAM-dependent methyltransferase